MICSRIEREAATTSIYTYWLSVGGWWVVVVVVVGMTPISLYKFLGTSCCFASLALSLSLVWTSALHGQPPLSQLLPASFAIVLLVFFSFISYHRYHIHTLNIALHLWVTRGVYYHRKWFDYVWEKVDSIDANLLIVVSHISLAYRADSGA